MNHNKKIEQNSFFVTQNDIAPMVNCLELLLKKVEKLEQKLTGEIVTEVEPQMLKTIELNHRSEIWEEVLALKVKEQKEQIQIIHKTFISQKKRYSEASDGLFSFIKMQKRIGKLQILDYLPFDPHSWEVRLFQFLGEKRIYVGVKGKLVVLYELVSNLLAQISVEDRGSFFNHNQEVIDWILEKRDTWGYNRSYSLIGNQVKSNHHPSLAIFDKGRFYYIVETKDTVEES